MAASTYERALSLVLKHEGGYVDDAADPGGATNLGVTIGTLSLWLGRSATKAEVKALTVAKVAPIYRQRFWDKIQGDALPAGLDYALFDFAVNSGPKRAIIGLQRAVGVADDGVFGPITLAAVASRDARTLIGTLCAGRLAFLQALSTWGRFGKGWTTRVNDVRATALAMAVAPPVVAVVVAAPVPPSALPPVLVNTGAQKPVSVPAPVPTTSVTTGGLWASLKSLFVKKAA